MKLKKLLYVLLVGLLFGTTPSQAEKLTFTLDDATADGKDYQVEVSSYDLRTKSYTIYRLPAEPDTPVRSYEAILDVARDRASDNIFALKEIVYYERGPDLETTYHGSRFEVYRLSNGEEESATRIYRSEQLPAQSESGAEEDLQFRPLELAALTISGATRVFLLGEREIREIDTEHNLLLSVIDGLEHPSHLAIDHIRQRLYWASSAGGLHQINSCSLDSCNDLRSQPIGIFSSVAYDFSRQKVYYTYYFKFIVYSVKVDAGVAKRKAKRAKALKPKKEFTYYFAPIRALSVSENTGALYFVSAFEREDEDGFHPYSIFKVNGKKKYEEILHDQRPEAFEID